MYQINLWEILSQVRALGNLFSTRLWRKHPSLGEKSRARAYTTYLAAPRWDKENHYLRYLPYKYSYKSKASTKNDWENDWAYKRVPDCVARTQISVSEKGALVSNHLSFGAFPTWWRPSHIIGSCARKDGAPLGVLFKSVNKAQWK